MQFVLRSHCGDVGLGLKMRGSEGGVWQCLVVLGSVTER